MAYKYSLEHLTTLMLPPVELIRTAAKVGYDAVSIRFIGMRLPNEPDYDPSHQPQLKKDIRLALDDTGLFINDIEVARITAEIDPMEYEPQFEAAAELGVHQVLSSVWCNDMGLASERFAKLCDLAARYRLPVSLEFVSWACVPTLDEALAFLKAAGNPANAGLLVDTLHAYRTYTKPEQLKAVADKINFIHLCDGPKEIPADRKEHVTLGRDGRLYPGVGSIPLREYVQAVGKEVVLAIELPNSQYVQQYGIESHARNCVDYAKKIFG